ncbi:MAG: hypothetical protein ACLFPL_02610 [Candidatus Nanoarchaeia archaeon]
MLWEKKTKKHIREDSKERGYLYLRVSEYQRDGRTLMRKPKHLGDGSAYQNRNKYIVKRDIYLGKIKELTPHSFLSFQDYIITQLQKESDYLYYILNYSFEEILFDFISYLQEIYNIPFQISYHDIVNQERKTSQEHTQRYKTQTFALKTGGFFNIILFGRVFNFEPKKRDDISSKDFEHFSNRCIDAGVFDEYIQMVLYLKLINTGSIESIEEELYQLDIEKIQQLKQKQISFVDFIKNER